MCRLEALPKRLTLSLRYITRTPPLGYDRLELLCQGNIVIDCSQRLKPLTKRGLDTDVRPLLPLDQPAQLTQPPVQSGLCCLQAGCQTGTIVSCRQPPKVTKQRPRQTQLALSVLQLKVLIGRNALYLIAASDLFSEISLRPPLTLLTSRRQSLIPLRLSHLNTCNKASHLDCRARLRQLRPFCVGLLPTGGKVLDITELTESFECLDQFVQPRESLGGRASLLDLLIRRRHQLLETLPKL